MLVLTNERLVSYCDTLSILGKEVALSIFSFPVVFEDLLYRKLQGTLFLADSKEHCTCYDIKKCTAYQLISAQFKQCWILCTVFLAP